MAAEVVPDQSDALRIDVIARGEQVEGSAVTLDLGPDAGRIGRAHRSGCSRQGNRPCGRIETTPRSRASPSASARNCVRLPSGASVSNQCRNSIALPVPPADRLDQVRLDVIGEADVVDASAVAVGGSDREHRRATCHAVSTRIGDTGFGELECWA